MAPPRAKRIIKSCEWCQRSFEVTIARQDRRFCSKVCSNRATARKRAEALIGGPHGYQPTFCPCGEPVVTARRYNYTKKYCSPECRVRYGGPIGKPKDPANYVTFGCLACGKEVTRLKSFGYQ